jgi:hypothetical protein
MAAAVLACVATSAPRWHIPAPLPDGAPTSTVSGGSALLVLDIEASAQPETFTCGLDGLWLDLVPLHVLTKPGATFHAEYVCPPGGELQHPELSGRGNGGFCHESTPPDDAFLRVTRYGAVPFWSRNLVTVLPLHPDESDSSRFRAEVQVHGAGQAVAYARIAPGSDPRVTERPDVTGFGQNRFQISQYAAVGAANPVSVELEVFEFGACPTLEPCAGPADEVVTVEDLHHDAM